MFVKDHIVRVENIKSIQKLDAAGIDHKVIALFLSDNRFMYPTKEAHKFLKIGKPYYQCF